ncbi:MAG: hypothetical protein MHMPM18_004854 [Marteilia pararefringens]
MTNINLNGRTIQICIRDMAGQKSLEFINKAALNQKEVVDFSTNSTIILFIVDVTVSASLDSINTRWYGMLKNAHKASNMKFVPEENSFLICNKMDLYDPNNKNHLTKKKLDSFGLGSAYSISAVAPDNQSLDSLTDILHRWTTRKEEGKRKKSRWFCA